MKTTLKIINIGSSKGVILPIHIVRKMELKKDDLVEIDIRKINSD